MNQHGRLIQMASNLQKEIEGAFSELIHTRWGTSESFWIPLVDIFENASSYLIVIDIPGVDPSHIEFTLKETSLQICGHRNLSITKNKGRRIIAERSIGRFCRTICLPAAVDTSKPNYTCTNGLLEIELTKK
jgi:HSP20 family protein